jgi:DAK2 domain fusion protein YloV
LLRRVVLACTYWLGQHRTAINSLNVFPVPDGDTGTNMHMTMQAAAEALAPNQNATAADVAARAARGALLGARGNSGVILSQLLAGFAHGLRAHERFDVAALVDACDQAVAYAYRAVTRPVEGTILTVARDTAAAVRTSVERGADLLTAMAAAMAAARDSVASTPDLMPLLKEAGVVDAGGRGLNVILEGAQRFALRQSLQAANDQVVVRPERSAALRAAHSLDEHGYCTNFMVRGAQLNAADLRDALGQLGTSLLVVGDDEILKVHVHTDRPGDALNLGAAQGELTGIEIANMRDQARDLGLGAENQIATTRRATSAKTAGTAQTIPPAPHPQVAAPVPLAVVAVAPGLGIADIFESFGVRTVPGGQSMNPSIEELLRAVEATKADAVIVLPNNRNIVMAAGQVVALASRTVEVVPTTTVPAGIAAAVAFSRAQPLEVNVEAMRAAAQALDTIELSIAARDATVNGVAIAHGDVIGLLNDDLVTHGSSYLDVALVALDHAIQSTRSLVTIYTGDGADPDEAQALSEAIRDRFPALEVEIVEGGQPHYRYMLGIE